MYFAMKTLFAQLSITILLALPGPGARAQDSFITIGTGSTAGLYYGVGQTLCRILSGQTPATSKRCYAIATNGSQDNIERLVAGKLQWGLAQSDTQSQAVKGQGVFKQPLTDLRAVAWLYTEPLAIVVRRDANVKTLSDLKGKRVNIGPTGSGQHGLGMRLFQALGFTPEDLARISQLPPAKHGDALCSQQIDAFLYVIAHPATNISAPLQDCQAQLIGLDPTTIERMVRQDASLQKALIPGGTYASQPLDTWTIGPAATLLTSKTLSEQQVYEATQVVFENLDALRAVHPALSGLKPKTMAQAPHGAPLHPGAARYYRSQGWLP